ncbi:hypothetical protein LAZ67_22001911 [Cordylochernes scorpioides]|uniref:Reverse transcriptase domain-containing protein n=1 Tax=Cordylochernes scorpioides TaxID=51811 RepID=A0ABY6LPB3_9ARAC|nr:hypothetical protein LAZ67_22001911 [Cordylochernes scorpioides]
MAQIQPPETFDFSTPNEWPKWRKRFERYLVVSGMKKKEEADKIDLFMYLMGDRADNIFRTFKFEKEEEATKFDSVLKAFDSHFCVRKNIIYERAKFNSRIQEDREPVDEFITSLYKLADSCEFEGFHEQLIRDRIVVGVRDKALSERMQLDSELTLEKAVKMVRQQEAVRQQQVDLQRPSTSQKVNQVKFNSKKQSPKQQQQPSRKKEKSAKTRSRCPKCGGFTHREGQACRAEGQKCNLCSKTGHFANCCPDKQAKTAEVKAVSDLDEEIGFLLEVSAVEDSSNLDDDEGECRRRWTAEIQVNGKQLKFKLDSQADVTCVPLCLFKKIMGQQRLVKSDINLRAAEFSELQTVGMFISTLRNGNYEIKEKIYVIRRLSEPLLSRRACELLNLARRIEVVATRINPIKEFPEVFEGLGQIGNPYEIKLKPGAKPYAVHTPRRVPIPLMEKLKTRLEELEKAGIIAQVNVATEWCAPTVIAGKPNGDIRLCVDLSRLNEHVQREVHPMPVVEHMLGQLGEARFFSKLDANSGFHQIPLSPDCQHLTTFITPFGRYKYCRMPFGISLAPEYFQRVMSIILQGMDGVMCYLDDILIFASDSKTHDRILRLVLRKLKEAKVTLNKAKCVFGVPRINFLGHILDEDGIRPDPAKIEAVAEMPAPTDDHGVRRYLGMVNHLGRKLRTTLPIAPENLNPRLVDSQTLKRKEGRRRKDMKSRYDRRCGATDMEELSEGDTVWITDMRTWGIVKRKASTPRSYMVDTPVGTLRRNRFHLRKGYAVQYPADPSTPTFSGEELVENEKTPVVDYPSNDSEDGQIRTRIFQVRVDLPDNLKVLFRPVSVVLPDSVYIMEIMMFGEGFSNPRGLAKRINTVITMCVSQLTKQNHYAYTLREMVYIIRVGAAHKAQNFNATDEEAIGMAMKRVLMPKLATYDIEIFDSIINDTFPGLTIASLDHNEELEQAIRDALAKFHLQEIPQLVNTISQLQHLMTAGSGILIVGNPACGKSTCWKVLYEVYKELAGVMEPFENVQVIPMNAKAMTVDEFYGFYKPNGDWQYGVLADTIRNFQGNKGQLWVVLDGPLDAFWVESMNSVLDDNRTLTLVNGERLSVSSKIIFLFEIPFMEFISPAVVSRCVVVYQKDSPEQWEAMVDTWIAKHPTLTPEILSDLKGVINKYIPTALKFQQTECKELIPKISMNCIQSLLHLLDCFITAENGIDQSLPNYDIMLKLWFLFCLIWSFFSGVTAEGRARVDNFFREEEESYPSSGLVYDYVVDVKTGTWQNWADRIPTDAFTYNPNLPLSKMIVPTLDTVRYVFLITALLSQGHRVLITGNLGCGKTLIAKMALSAMTAYNISFFNFSGTTTAGDVVTNIESRVEKRQKGHYYPIGIKKLIMFIDDFNLPVMDPSKSQPPLECLRFLFDYGCIYEKKSNQALVIRDIAFMAAMSPPGNGRNTISTRLQWLFDQIFITPYTEAEIDRLFGSIIGQKLSDFEDQVKSIEEPLVKSATAVYLAVVEKLRPTPSKSHYIFTMRDMTRASFGMLFNASSDFSIMSSLVSKCLPFRTALSLGNRKKSFGAMYGE